MNFQNINAFVVVLNNLSGNIFPLTDKKFEFSCKWKIYAFFWWLVEFLYVILTIYGLFLVPKVKTLQDGTVNIVVLLEALVLSLYFTCRRKSVKRFIKLMNQLLSDSDKIKVHC